MSEKPISPLRQRMLEDMNVRRFTPDTQREYVRAVKRLAAFLGRTPDTATAEELRTFQVHLTETGVRPPTTNATVTALRFFLCRPNFLLPVRVLSKLFRRLMLTKLEAAHTAGQLQFFGVHAHLADAKAFAAFLVPLRKTRWFVYSKRPFAGPKAVLAYLSRYTHRVAISNRRLIAFDGRQVTFKVKDYRVEGPGRYTTMTLDVDEFIRRFLIHVLPKGFHRR